ncbi:MAG: hypothetical protein NTX24_03645 [Candidatus Pacearchaeota archaeon]|nr:hypothetical protein [Candidatus Pacearchaeota archaeon]
MVHAWDNLDSNPQFSLACTDNIIAYYAEAERKGNFEELEAIKPLYEEALTLRDIVQIPKTCLELLLA